MYTTVGEERTFNESLKLFENFRNNLLKIINFMAKYMKHTFSRLHTVEKALKQLVTNGDRTTWEYHTVSVTRVPGYGFGIAVSGGRDNPHFANGDPSIAVSDVLKGGPAEDRLQVNDRIISVNGVSLENVEYATAVQTSSGNSQPIKVTLTKSSKKDDYGIVLGCRLFIKEISTKARDQLAANGYTLQEGDIITRIHNTNCGDNMSLKEAKKIIDGCKERLNLVVLRDITNQAAITNQLNNSNNQSNIYGSSHQPQLSNCSNNLDDPYLNGGASYSSQNLYVQPPTRSVLNGPSSGLNEEKSNLTPRGRSRGPIMDGMALQQLDRPSTPPNVASSRARGLDDPPRPPPPRNSTNNAEDFYSSRRQLYEDETLARSRQSAEPRFISFQKEGSVGIRLTGGNEAGIFVTAVQPGSPASLQGLTPGDKILKVNDMDMHGVTREEAVLFLLSLQDRIDLIVQYCKEEYDEVVNNQRGDSFHIKIHFHCENPSKGEMAFKAGDVFRVIDTLHNGVVGSWQVLKIGRGHQEMQRGVIPNKSRAEELATAQFNATKKEMNTNESRGNFFRRRRSTHRRSKSLSRENWDDVVFSDSISKFPAYERVVLRHPGFVRPVVIFGPISDLAREKLAKDFPDKFSTPLQDDDKSNSKCRIVRLSNIRDVMDRGKHALLDITPNAVDRLNYAQFYPIVIFLKTDSKHVIKQLRHGMPKSAHKSSKKLLEQCQKLERVWSHIFSTQIVLSDEESWYRKLRDAIDLQQSGAVWMSESKPVESLSDDFLFPMTTSRLSYASSPESDLELSPGPSASLSLGNLPQLVKSSSDPSIATNQDNLDRDRDIIGEGLPPPYTIPYDHAVNPPTNRRQTTETSKYGVSGGVNYPSSDPAAHANRPQSLYGINAPDLPPRIDRQSKPGPGELPINTPPSRSNSSGGTMGRTAQERLFGKAIVSDDVQAEYITRTANNSNNNSSPADALERHHASLERQARLNAAQSKLSTPAGSNLPPPSSATNQPNGSYDSVSSYDSYSATQLAMQNLGRLGPNAPDDLKSVPNANAGRPLPPVVMNAQQPQPEYGRSTHDHRQYGGGANDLNRQNSPGRPPFHDINTTRNIDPRTGPPQRPSNLGLEGSPRKVETKTDYGKYSRSNSASQADYNKLSKTSSGPPPPHMVVPVPPANINGNNTPSSSGSGPFKPVPPPKPKNYRPPLQNAGNTNSGHQWDGGEPGSPRSPNGFYYPPVPTHHHYGGGQQATPGSPHHGPTSNTSISATYGTNNNYGPPTTPGYPTPVNGYNNGNPSTSHHYNGGSGTGPYIAPHRGMPPPIDLAGSREQRGSAFELYRKPQIGTTGHHHNISEMGSPYGSAQEQLYTDYYAMPPTHKPPPRRSKSAPRYPYDLPPPHMANSGYYHNNYIAAERYPIQQYYPENDIPPPLPPPKVKKKSLLKSPLTVIKNALIKSTRPLRRMNSMVEPERKSKGLRRQHSMLERGVQRPYYPDEYPTYPAGLDERYYASKGPVTVEMHHQYYSQDQQEVCSGLKLSDNVYNQALMNNTYQNLETEDIYGHLSTVPRGGRLKPAIEEWNGYEDDKLYVNRALIDLERRQAEAMAAMQGRNGRRIIRRHSTTTADRASNSRRPLMIASDCDRNEDLLSKPCLFSNDIQNRAPNSEVMTRRRFYPGASHEMAEVNEPIYQSRRDVQREMQKRHLYQTKKEMQDRIIQGKRDMEKEFSPQTSSTHSEMDDKSERDFIYQSKREAKEGALKTRVQLREQIYQTRRETLESMAEPGYIMKRDMGRPEPIYETKEENILQSRENETDEKKESKHDITVVEISHEPDTLTRTELQKSTDTVIENIIEVNEAKTPNSALKAPLVQSEDCDDLDNEPIRDFDKTEMPTLIENQHNCTTLEESVGMVEVNTNENISDEVFEMAKTSNVLSEKTSTKPLDSSKSIDQVVKRSMRTPFHISNILKRTAPPPTLKPLNESRTSVETQYTSQASLPVGPPNATSTPYPSNMSLPIAGPVPISAPTAASLPGQGSFPPLPREPTTTRGIFDSTGGTLTDNVWNVSLQIPPFAIPTGVRQEIYFTVSDPRLGQAVGGPPLDMENGETMLSPLVMCGPQGLEFLIPVTLNIPHCAGRTASLGLALKATDIMRQLILYPLNIYI
uniref:Tight junction protein ZO-1 n=1 Tax=Glossina brevipalpis TaxID=37001 RepID=A0A1A9WH03_9MUSC